MHYLTDFKALQERESELSQEQYEELRKELYSKLAGNSGKSRLSEVVSESKKLKKEKSGSEGEGVKMRNPLKADLEDLKNRYFMKQSWDKSMTDADREKLAEVLEEKKKHSENL